MVFKILHQNHLEAPESLSVKIQLAGPHPRAAHSVDVGQAATFVCLTSREMLLMLLAQESHFDNDWLIESRNFFLLQLETYVPVILLSL